MYSVHVHVVLYTENFTCTILMKSIQHVILVAISDGKETFRGIDRLRLNEAKSRKYQGVFEVKSRVKRHDGKFEEFGLNNWSISKSQYGGRNQVSGRVSVPCWHATPVANAPWKPLLIR